MSDRAIVVRQGESRQLRSPLGDLIDFKAGEADTGGAFSLHERVAPPGARSAMHVHRRVIEAFYVIDGVLEMRVGDESFVADAGTFVMVPRGVRHAWRNVSESDACVLVIFSPSGERAYFEKLDEITRAAGDGDVDMQQVIDLSKRYGWD